MSLINKINSWIVRKIFEKRFKYFIYPFERSDEVIERLSYAERLSYLEDCNRWFKSKAYKTEMEELLRTFYQELSLKSTSEIHRTGYRLGCIFVKNMENRLNYLQTLYEAEDNKKITNKI